LIQSRGSQGSLPNPGAKDPSLRRGLKQDGKLPRRPDTQAGCGWKRTFDLCKTGAFALQLKAAKNDVGEIRRSDGTIPTGRTSMAISMDTGWDLKSSLCKGGPGPQTGLLPAREGVIWGRDIPSATARQKGGSCFNLAGGQWHCHNRDSGRPGKREVKCGVKKKRQAKTKLPSKKLWEKFPLRDGAVQFKEMLEDNVAHQASSKVPCKGGPAGVPIGSWSTSQSR